MNLTEASKEDIPDILLLYQRAIVPIWTKIGRDYSLKRIRQNLIEHLGGLNHYHHVVRDEDGALVAYRAWQRHLDATSEDVIAHLHILLVDPSFQRRGIAAKLLQDFEEHARELECTKILFDGAIGNPAHAFYEKLGYRCWSAYMQKRLS